MRSYRLESDVIKDIRRVVCPIPSTYICKLNLNYVAGFPDLVYSVFGHTVFLEVKRWRGKFAPIQVQTIKKMREAGMLAYGLRAKNSDTTQLVDFQTGKVYSGSLMHTVLTAWRQ